MNFYTLYFPVREKRGKFFKTLLVMKMAIFIICAAFLQVSASTSLAQKVTLNEKNVPLEKVFNDIKKQTGYIFFYEDNVLTSTANVSINIKNVALKDALDLCLKNQPLIYTIAGNTIGVKKKEETPIQTKTTAIPITVFGKVTDTTGTALPGATIKIFGQNAAFTTASDGTFSFKAQTGDKVEVSFIGYKPYSFTVNNENSLTIVLHLASSKLNEVLVSTGYQTLPAERATGSFVQIDNNLINRSVSTDIISRLQDVTSGLNFDRRAGGQPYLDIRSRGTILANDQPLIVLDNFPYDGDINNINPNDVESVTVLKDAAAASIWGVRAGNGVIVITTKKGKYNQSMKIDFNANLNLGQKPQLSKLRWISSSDYIDLEKNLFDQGYYDADFSNTTNPPASTPVVDLLAAARNGDITQATANAEINALKQYDVRKDMEKYLYRTSVNQQYAVNINGGSEKQKYYFSAGYDKNLDNIINNSNDRLTLRAANTFRPIKKLEITTDLIYTRSNTSDNGLDYNSISTGYPYGLYPYARLADNNGNPLAIPRDYSNSFKQTAESQGLLNWAYIPLNELNNANNKSVNSDFRLTTSAKFNILSTLSASVLYTYERSELTGTNLFSQDTYYTRNLINQYTMVNADGSLTQPIPLGGILDQSYSTINSNDIRAQLNFDQNWKDNKITAIAGYEVSQLTTNSSSNRLYGYNDDNLSYNSQMDYNTFFTTYDGNNLPITPGSSISGLFNGNVSYYSNAAYTYKDRYTISGSARFDQSNLFGVKTNQKGVPLWSIGGSWNLDKEAFYKIDWLPYLKLRVTDGYNGNLDRSLSALTTAAYIGVNSAGYNQASIINPPNPELRWEKNNILNVGIDFSTKGNILSGSLEYYHKKGTDLLGFSPVDATTGVTSFEGNVADNEGNGVDIELNAHIIDKTFKWHTNVLYSYASDKVTKFLASSTNISGFVSGTVGRNILPIEGKPVFGVYSYKWAGLDPVNGNPRGYLPNGSISEDYAALQNISPANLVYNGPGRPTSFGSFRNTFSYKNLSLSANIAYEFGFYFHKPSINYTSLFSNLAGSSDYAQRWQKPGDEKTTNVPSFQYPFDNSRDLFYAGSSALVEKGDNIRLRDVNISYDISKSNWPSMPFQSLRFYLYANNLKLIWTANKSGIDPDYPTLPPQRTIAFGIKAGF